MKYFQIIPLILFSIALCPNSSFTQTAPDSAASYAFANPGAYKVDTAEYTWHDVARDRDVPVKIYYPENITAPCPVIVFSHGLGGSREGYSYLGEYWAGHGYISVHPTHKGSDTDILKHTLRPLKALREAADDPANLINRPKDISFVIDKLFELNKNDKLFKGKFNLDEIGVAGHSFGGYTSLASGGMTLITPDGKDFTLMDKRIKAGIAMSPPAKKKDTATLKKIYGSIKIPFFVMTGTKDQLPFANYSSMKNSALGTIAEDRRIPFDNMNGPDDYLIVFNGADHMTFSGRLMNTKKTERNDKEFQKYITMSSTAFWDAYLKGDVKAKQWLAGGGFKQTLGNVGTFEVK